ncbi:MAG: NAD(P)-binding domain-containing protein [Saprospiraceae bacterium]|nr:NAD(P)-binding domain-containing protein [Saprospiraceae bacterium]
MKSVGIIGSGPVGIALAKGFISNGYPTIIGSRDEKKRNELEEQIGCGINTGSFEEVAATSDIIVLAVKGSVALKALQLAGKENLRNKVIIDTTNPIADQAPENGVLVYFQTEKPSLMETLQTNIPDGNFVKAFSCVGSSHMIQPDFELKPSMFICGNNTEAKQEVGDILHHFGWETEDMGNAEAARAIEPLAMLWCIPGFRENQWNHAFKLLKKSK